MLVNQKELKETNNNKQAITKTTPHLSAAFIERVSLKDKDMPTPYQAKILLVTHPIYQDTLPWKITETLPPILSSST